MSFTERTITHTFHNADKTPASGSIEFTLTKRMTNGTETIVPSSLTSNLNGSGELSQVLTSNKDASTTPGDSKWRVDFRILGDQPESYFITVPTGPGSTNLGELLPKQGIGG